ncbi:MAG: hypothetical protein ABIJ97_15535, partial [Bacteroidota bacterium]
EYDLYLYPGANEIQLFAENSEGSEFAFSIPLTITYFDLEKQVKESDLHVVIINVPEYTDKKINKDYIQNQCDKIKNVLISQEGILYKSIIFHEYVYIESTSASIINQLIETLPGRLKENDDLIIFMSGIITKDVSGNFFLLASDTKNKDLYLSSVNLKSLAKKISFIHGNTSIFFDISNQLHESDNQGDIKFSEFFQKEIIHKSNYSLLFVEGAKGTVFDSIIHGFHKDNDLNGNNSIDIEELNIFISKLNKTILLTKGRNIPLFLNAGQ